MHESVSPFSLAPEQFMARTYSDIGLTDHSSLRELTVKGLLGEVFDIDAGNCTDWLIYLLATPNTAFAVCMNHWVESSLRSHKELHESVSPFSLATLLIFDQQYHN